MTRGLSLVLGVVLSWQLVVSADVSAQSPTDEQLLELERQIEQQEAEQAEVKQRAEAETKRKVEEEAKKIELEKQRAAEEESRKKAEQEQTRLEEERRKAEEARLAEFERKQKEEIAERLRAEKEKQEKYNKHIQSAEAYMADEKYDMAIHEYQIILNLFPDDIQAANGISEARKYLNACGEIVGNWYIEPIGLSWDVHDDQTVFGTWLIFGANGNWECLSSIKREFVFNWPGCAVCNTDYFVLSEDGSTLHGTRNSSGATGRRVIDSEKDTTPKRESP